MRIDASEIEYVDQGAASKIVTLEEHQLAGGMGSAIAEIFIDEGITIPLLRIGQNDKFVFELGGRQEIWKTHGLDVAGILKQIKEKSIVPITR